MESQMKRKEGADRSQKHASKSARTMKKAKDEFQDGEMATVLQGHHKVTLTMAS